MNNEKGVVLLIVLWVLLVLSLIAWGLGRRSSLEVSVLETYRGKLRSYAAARAGLNRMLDLLQKSPSTRDSLYLSGVTIDAAKTPADVFAHMDTGHNTFAMVAWRAKNYSTGDNNTPLEYGLRDEGGRLNLNAIGIVNYPILSALLQLQGLSQPDADKLAMAIINYSGINSAASNNNTFMNLDQSRLKPKNKRYENVLELLEVDGMTQKIFDKIKDDVTVYGNSQTGLWINTDTANNDVIQALANASARVNSATTAQGIIDQAYGIRDGADGQSFTADDGTASIAMVNDPNWPAALQEGVSSYYRARVVGVDGDSGTRTVIEAVIHQRPGGQAELLSWQRN